ncbi:D-inositol-3-phosphate glycosyltransferase [uncultured archaeon]|nr:D-inositol-3-phosphate glycosyltransferase [uncultured archaeon]
MSVEKIAGHKGLKGPLLLINNRPLYCGIGEYTYSLYNALRQLLGDEVELLSWRGELVERLYSKVRERDILQKFEEAMRVSSQAMFMLKIPKRYALYHVTNSSLSIVARRVKPCVVTVHDLFPFTSPRDLTDYLIRRSVRALEHADSIICVSHSTRNDLLHFLDIDPAMVKVIYEGVNHNLFQPRDKMNSRRILGLPTDKMLVLHVGSEEPRKNIPTLINAFHELQKEVPEATLVRVGEKTTAVQRLINSLELNDKILYFSDVKDLGCFYNASDLFAFPSYSEGFGFPPLQAMASGCPVIASNATSIPEVVGDAGILIDPSDTDDFAHWMHEVHVNEELKSRLIRDGIKRSRAFDWEKCAQETLEVYREVMQ